MHEKEPHKQTNSTTQRDSGSALAVHASQSAHSSPPGLQTPENSYQRSHKRHKEWVPKPWDLWQRGLPPLTFHTTCAQHRVLPLMGMHEANHEHPATHMFGNLMGQG